MFGRSKKRLEIERDSAKLQSMSPDVQALIEAVHERCVAGAAFELWVPDVMSEAPPGEPTGMVMAILTDAALSHAFWPDGFIAGEGGRHYRYKPDAE